MFARLILFLPSPKQSIIVINYWHNDAKFELYLNNLLFSLKSNKYCINQEQENECYVRKECLMKLQNPGGAESTN